MRAAHCGDASHARKPARPADARVEALLRSARDAFLVIVIGLLNFDYEQEQEHDYEGKPGLSKRAAFYCAMAVSPVLTLIVHGFG